MDGIEIKVMNKEELYKKYRAICKKYGVTVNIEFVTGEKEAQAIEGNTIRLNTDKISEADLEDYIAYNVRKLLLPHLVLSTDRLTIRRFQPSDAEDCFAFLSDKETCYSDGGYEPFCEMNEAYNSLMDKFAGQEMRKMVALKDTGKVIGTINLMEADDRAVETYEIGYVIAPEYQRKGYAYEAVSAVLNCLLQELHLDMVIGGAVESNRASIGLLEKLGFQYEGRKTKAFYHPELGVIDLQYYVKER